MDGWPLPGEIREYPDSIMAEVFREETDSIPLLSRIDPDCGHAGVRAMSNVLVRSRIGSCSLCESTPKGSHSREGTFLNYQSCWGIISHSGSEAVDSHQL
jgi:hypothetical protein